MQSHVNLVKTNFNIVGANKPGCGHADNHSIPTITKPFPFCHTYIANRACVCMWKESAIIASILNVNSEDVVVIIKYIVF